MIFLSNHETPNKQLITLSDDVLVIKKLAVIIHYLIPLYMALRRLTRNIGGHVAAARKRSHQWCLTLTPDSTETIGRMTCHCFLVPVGRDLTSSSYTADMKWLQAYFPLWISFESELSYQFSGAIAGFNHHMQSTLFEEENFGSGVPVIWTTPRFRHPHSQNPSDMGIPFSY